MAANNTPEETAGFLELIPGATWLPACSVPTFGSLVPVGFSLAGAMAATQSGDVLMVCSVVMTDHSVSAGQGAPVTFVLGGSPPHAQSPAAGFSWVLAAARSPHPWLRALALPLFLLNADHANSHRHGELHVSSQYQHVEQSSFLTGVLPDVRIQHDVIALETGS